MNLTKQQLNAVESKTQLGGGAQFWVYISPMHDTAEHVTEWKVTFSQGSWSGSIDSSNPQQMLKTDNMSGKFDLVVEASGPNFASKKISVMNGCMPNIGCNTNCASMVAIVANEAGTDAGYCTTWDAMCSMNNEEEA